MGWDQVARAGADLAAALRTVASLPRQHRLDAEVARRARVVEEDLRFPDRAESYLASARLFLSWFNHGDIPGDLGAMLARVEKVLADGEELEGPELIFLIHEAVEEQMIRTYQELPHYSLRRLYGDFANIAPEVVAQFPEDYGQAWRDHWEIT